MEEWAEEHRHKKVSSSCILEKDAWTFFNKIKCILPLCFRHLWVNVSYSLYKREMVYKQLCSPNHWKNKCLHYILWQYTNWTQQNLNFGITESYWIWASKNLGTGPSIRLSMIWGRIREKSTSQLRFAYTVQWRQNYTHSGHLFCGSTWAINQLRDLDNSCLLSGPPLLCGKTGLGVLQVLCQLVTFSAGDKPLNTVTDKCIPLLPWLSGWLRSGSK